jgi:hypothetical protein
MVKFRHCRTGRTIELKPGDPRIAEYDRGRRWIRVAEPTPRRAPVKVATKPAEPTEEPSA